MMLNFERVADLLAGLTLMRFFPADDGARLELAKMVARMATTEAQVEWLVQRSIALYAEWPGAREIRACFCSKFQPADGLSVGSTVYLDGIPSERKIEAPALVALPPGHVASVDAGLEKDIRLLAAVKDLNHIPRRVPVQEPPTNPDFKPITQADINRAVDELHERGARAELGELYQKFL
jgi:hypothetical protein